jgi:autotransporter-associated beta strand protein/probable HAF family extracellular repeat protein
VVIGNSHNGFVYSNGQMTDLGSFWPNSINYKGQIVGNILYSSPDQTILYQNGTITDLGSLVENGNSSPFSINNGGQIAGMSDTQDQGGHSFIYSGGSMKDLNLLINSASWVLNGGVERGSDYMNESGQIAGVASKLINGNYQDRAFILTPFPWKGQGGGSWGNQNNWAVTDMPGNVGDSVYFSNKFGNSSGGTITLDGDRTVSTITFNDPNNVYSINSGNNPTSKIVLVNTDSSWAMLIVTNGNHSVTAPVELQADACVETLLNNTSLNISGQITESGGPKSLTKLDDGLLILSGDNKYTGQTIIEEGILELSSTGQIDKSSNIITDDNGTFQINGGSHTVGSISGTGMTEVISGELTADSIVQDTLTIGSGTEINIANNPGRTLSINDNLSSVPEPSNFALLFVGSMCYCLWGRPVHWIRYEVDGVVFSRLGARKDSKLGVDSSIY